MMRSRGLFIQVFLSILAVSLFSTLATGFVARAALASAFENYLMSGPEMGPGMMLGRGTGHMVLGVAEETFLAGVDRGIIISVAIAVVLAAIASYLIARYVTRPLERLRVGAQVLATGELEHRVSVVGPGEVEDLADAFNDMADSLERAEELRRRLVADVAHELRNPIAALRAQTEGIAEGVLEADEARIGSLVDDITHLSRLVDDLQELSVAEAGRLRYDMGDVDLCELVRREAARAEAVVSEGVTLGSVCPEGPLVVSGDEFRLSQVLRNLLSNAARHTSAGSIEVKLESGDGFATVTVADTGEGIGAADLPLIFERFYRADAARSKQTGGTGVGLAIARRIVQDHGGDVFATSTPNEGSSIGFWVPAR